MQKVKLWISAFPGVDVLMLSTSLLLWWHIIPISTCQVVPGRRLHNHSVILEWPCMFLSNGASWPELFLGIRFTTTLDPLVIGASISFSPKQVQDRSPCLRRTHNCFLMPLQTFYRWGSRGAGRPDDGSWGPKAQEEWAQVSWAVQSNCFQWHAYSQVKLDSHIQVE